MKGLHFGGSLIDRTTLRASILYYDHILHYDVVQYFATSPHASMEYNRAVHYFGKETKLFVDEKLLRLIPLSSWTNRYRDVFRHILSTHFFPANDSQMTNIKRLAEIQRLVVLFQAGKPFQRPYISPADPNVFTDYIDNRPFYNLPPNTNMYIISALGREVTLGLLGAVELEAVPFTDLGLYIDTLAWLVMRCTNLESSASNSSSPAPADNQEIKPQVVQEALKVTLPALGNLPDEELLRFRIYRRDELSAFRQVLDDLAGQVQVRELTESTRQDLQLQMQSRLSPRLAELERIFKEQVAYLHRKGLEGASKTAVELTGYAGWPFEAAVGPAVQAAGKWSAEEIEHLTEKARLRQNGLYFLWKVR